jgi:hypothetical protein
VRSSPPTSGTAPQHPGGLAGEADQLGIAMTGLALPLAVLCPVQALVYLRRVRKNEKALIEMVSRKD